MSQPAQHTVFRFNLRSMLMLTFGVAVIMAVASPYIRAMDAAQQQHLLFTVIAVALGMTMAAVHTIRRRRRLGLQSGLLLLSLELKLQRKKVWLRWVWLLLVMPLAILFFYFQTIPIASKSTSLFGSIRGLPFTIFYSWWLAQLGLSFWAEGCANAIEFCENGIVMQNRFFAWSAQNLREMYWSQTGDKIVINVSRTATTIYVPVEDRKAAGAILSDYFQNRVTDQS